MNYKWDLDSLLDGKKIEDLFDEYVNRQNELMRLYSSFIDSEDNFINFLEKQEDFTCCSNRLYNYLSNNYQEDLSNPTWISWIQKLNNQSIEFTKLFSDYENIVIKNKSKIEKYLQNPKISEFKRIFDQIFKFEKHLLSKENELLMSQIQIYNSSNDDIYSSLVDNDLTFDDAEDSQHNKVKINTQSDIFKNLKSKDETLRKTSWYSFHKAFYKFRNTLTKCLYYNYLTLNTNAKIRHFEDYIDSTAFTDEIPKSFISNLYEKIKTYKPLIEKYQKVRQQYLKKILKKDTLMPWDNSVELSEDQKRFEIEEVKSIAKDSLRILGDDYVNLVQKAFDERWISFMPSPNKQTGAYSIGGTKGLNKYFISMNYDSTIQSIYTLVHELGHSINSYFYGQKQKIYQNTSIFYAEISSITNEMLLNDYFLKKYESDPKTKIMILDEIISGFFNTTTRQIIFSNFEWLANNWVNKGEEFTYEKISKTYYDLMNQYLYVEKSYEDYTKDPYIYSLITPLRIGHFFVGNFYVYKYCIGQIAAVIISNRIINNIDGAKQKLFNFLSSGNSLSPLDTIKLLGIDLLKNEPYEEAKSILSNWIDEFENAIKELN